MEAGKKDDKKLDTGSKAGGSGWTNFKPKMVQREDQFPESMVKTTWAAIYDYAGVASGSEDDKKSIRAGVYAYCMVNGSSPECLYVRDVVCSTGVSFGASILKQATSNRIRQFLRGCLQESYDFLKESKVAEDQPRFIRTRQDMGIPAEFAFATADWLTNYERMTEAELKYHNVSKDAGFIRSRRARAGKTVEQLRDERVEASMDAQGPEVAAPQGSRIDF
jgi:hypothetical protein